MVFFFGFGKTSQEMGAEESSTVEWIRLFIPLAIATLGKAFCSRPSEGSLLAVNFLILITSKLASSCLDDSEAISRFSMRAAMRAGSFHQLKSVF